MSETASHAVRACRWIVSCKYDAAMFIASPLVIVPLILGVAFFVADEDVFLVVSTFGALGHHAPGLMRAYGDRTLFRRFWLRFTIVPIASLTMFLSFPLQQLPGITLILVFWSLWHFQMQTFGFGRIYDAKVGAVGRRNHYLDLALCMAWSGLCVLHAPGRVSDILSLALKSGLTFSLEIPLTSFRLAWTWATIAVTAMFLADLLRRIIVGKPVNYAKLLLFGTTFSFFWFCDVGVRNLILGIAMIELFHDVQYLAIVWLFNRNRAERDPSVGAFTQFLFRPGFAGLYVGIVVAYGFVAFAAKTLTSDLFQHMLLSIIATSNVLHFYYDGFIWKVRESDTRTALGVDTSGEPYWRVRRRFAGLRQRFAHPAKWLVLLSIVGALMAAERVSEMTELEQAQAVVDRVPDSVRARTTLAQELVKAEKYESVVHLCNEAIRRGESDFRTHMYLGIALTATNKSDSGFRELKRAFELHSRDPQLRFHLAMAYISRNQYDVALQHLWASVNMDGNNPVTRYNLGILQSVMGDHEAAVTCLEEVIQLNPAFAAAYRPLGESLLRLGNAAAALRTFRQGLTVTPDDNGLLQRIAEFSDTAIRNTGADQNHPGG